MFNGEGHSDSDTYNAKTIILCTRIHQHVSESCDDFGIGLDGAFTFDLLDF